MWGAGAWRGGGNGKHAHGQGGLGGGAGTRGSALTFMYAGTPVKLNLYDGYSGASRSMCAFRYEAKPSLAEPVSSVLITMEIMADVCEVRGTRARCQPQPEGSQHQPPPSVAGQPRADTSQPQPAQPAQPEHGMRVELRHGGVHSVHCTSHTRWPCRLKPTHPRERRRCAGNAHAGRAHTFVDQHTALASGHPSQGADHSAPHATNVTQPPCWPTQSRPQ
jgi:hypothetical protein